MEYFLDRVTENEKEILFRLLQYSLFEESMYDENEINGSGLFEYEYFEKYFTDTNRKAYFVKEKDNNKILGFAMINNNMKKCETGHSIAEFMIMPKYRRKKLGKNVAKDLFSLYKGNWEISPSFGSKTAYNFWENVINEYTNKDYKYEDGVFIFKNK